MPRKSRFYHRGVPVHAFQRGHNKSAVFFQDEDYLHYLRCLKSAADDCGCTVHAYVLMTNHVHLLLTPEYSDSISNLFRQIGLHFVRYMNTTYQRRGSLWEGRHKGNMIDTDSYFLMCMRYIEMNPVRAGIVSHPADYRWSSYAANALGIDNAILQTHPQYLSLGQESNVRQLAYRDLFLLNVEGDELDKIRASLSSGTPLGNDRFKQKIEEVMGRKIGEMRPGRPQKSPKSPPSSSFPKN